MKATLALALFTLIGSQAWSIDLPVGNFQFTNTQAVSTKHFHRLYNKSAKEQKLIADYRKQGYLCTRLNSSLTECSKKIETNPNQIKFKTEKLSALSPLFDEQIDNVNEITSGDAVTIYEIEQKNSLNGQSNNFYKAYDISESGFYVDVKKDDLNSLRFQMLKAEALSMFTFEKESLSKREYYRHSLYAFYRK